MKCHWFPDHVRQVHMDFHMPEFPPEAIRNFNAKQFVDHLERGRINMVALFAKCHFGNSFYNTRVGHKHAGLEQDFLGESAEQCRKRGIRTLAYYSLCVDKRVWDANPAWRHQKPDGTPISWDACFWGEVCMNTAYKDELVMPQLEEIAAYPVDGFWLDIPFARRLLCYCPCCRRKWKQQMGVDIQGPLDKRTYSLLVQRTVADYLREIRGIIRRVNPELVVTVNGVGTPHTSLEVNQLCEVGTWESQPHPGNYLGHSLAARTSRNDIMSVQVMSVRFYQGWGDLTLKPAAQMTTEFAAMIANGAPAVSGDQVNVDGTLQPPVYEMFHKSFGFVAEREAVLREADSVRHTVVLLPASDPQLPMDFAVTDDERKVDDSAWKGAHKMLVESHVQTDLVYSLLAEDLSKYPMIVLPEPGAYPAETYEKLRQYVRGGGTLLAVGNSLLHDGAFQLEDVFGVRFLGQVSFKNVHFVPTDAVRGATDAIPLQVRGESYKVELDGAEELAAMHYPIADQQAEARKEFRSPHSPARFERSPYPFATVHQFGKGKAVYLAAGLFAIYWRTNHHWLRQFVEAVIRHVDPAQPVDVDAAGTIEVNLMAAGKDLLVNLVHYSLGHQGGQTAISAIERVHPVADIPVRVRCRKPEAVVEEPAGTQIPFEYADGVCSFRVPRIEYLAIVRVKGGAAATRGKEQKKRSTPSRR